MMRFPSLRPARLGLLLATAAMASACSILPEKEPVDTYALPGTLAQRATGVSSAGISPSLRVVRPVAGGAIAGKRIVVMPEPDQFSVYQGAVWSEPAAQLVRDRIVDAFLADGRLPAITTDEGVMAHADLLLSSQLRDFQSVYENGQPVVVVRLDAHLLQASTNRIIASRSFAHRHAVVGKEVPQVVEAFGAASDRVAQDLVDWTVQHAVSR